jgi:ATP-dependent helicase/nuclease subunit B
LGGDRATELLADKDKYLEMAGALDGATEVKRLSPPKPCPPIAKRPVGLSVTQIETWIRDPYAIYARHILRLEKLDRIGMSPSALDRGILIHQVMEEFVHDHMDTLPPDALENLLERGKAAFAPLAVWPTEHAFWTTRFGRAAEWFLEDETHWRAAGNSPLALEVWGRTQIDGFEIRAKADRIDLGPKGLVLQDYKTGQTPTLNQVASGLSPQLPLEAIIARGGGFENVPAQSVADLVYVRLSGGSDPGARKNVLPEKPKKDGPQSTDEIVELVLAGFRKWIEQYRDPAHPYPSRFAPLSQSFQGDYDHLARVRAWLAGGDGDEE